MVSVDLIPNEMLLHVMRFDLSWQTVRSVRLVCKRWKWLLRQIIKETLLPYQLVESLWFYLDPNYDGEVKNFFILEVDQKLIIRHAKDRHSDPFAKTLIFSSSPCIQPTRPLRVSAKSYPSAVDAFQQISSDISWRGAPFSSEGKPQGIGIISISLPLSVSSLEWGQLEDPCFIPKSCDGLSIDDFKMNLHVDIDMEYDWSTFRTEDRQTCIDVDFWRAIRQTLRDPEANVTFVITHFALALKTGMLSPYWDAYLEKRSSHHSDGISIIDNASQIQTRIEREPKSDVMKFMIRTDIGTIVAVDDTM